MRRSSIVKKWLKFLDRRNRVIARPATQPYRDAVEPLERRRLLSAAISSVTLYNADSDQPITALTDGATINLAAIGTNRLSVVARTSFQAGSVNFDDSGSRTIENYVPYAIAGDKSDTDFNAWTPFIGTHKLTITAFSGANRTGAAGPSKVINFTVVNGATPNQNPLAPTVTALTLHNADNDQPITALTDGMSINLATLPSRNVNIVASTAGATSRVVYVFNGTTINENYTPFAIGGDNQGNLNPWTLPTGTHTLTATAFSATEQSNTR